MDGKKGIKVALGSFLIHFFATSMLAAAAVSISITNVVEWEKDKNFGMNRSQLNQIILNYGIMMISCGVTGVLGIPGYLGHLTSYTITIMLGGLLMALTLFLPSMSSGMAESGVVMIIQAIVLGIGISLNYIPAYTILAQWYHKRLGLMTGISLSGCALGTLVFSIINNSVIRNYGHVKAMQIQGIIIIVGCLMSSLLIKMHILKSKKAGFFDWKIISDTRFLVLASATLISGLGRYMFSWLTSTLLFMINIQHGGGNGVATCIVLVVSQLLGFIGGGYLSDRTGYIGFIGVSMFVFAISVLLLLAIIIPSSSLTPGMPEVISPTTWPIYIVLVLAGISNGTLGSVIPASILQMFGPVRLPSVTGLLVLTINILVFIPTVNYTIFNDSEAGGYNYINKEGFVILTILAFLATVIGGVFALCLPKLNRRYKRKLLMRELEQQHHEIRRESVVILSSEKEVEEEKKIETIIR
ncbi:putative transporter MCH2 [Zancudomyces culisetae]|uniref:Putative transporter MCH2 n=1 Tax=Zancudomyces culisetae TaxID=1213189 RepID=A0A1R1PXQ2_ZANCU|nr:putative transporter MCH2 [Zancudomyces culisetae]|eukprot:OMH85736.1 putative transporter MCH2 [Zancudomyces culisetae]